MRTKCAAGRLKLRSFSASPVSTFLNPGQALRLASYVCYRTDRLTVRGVTAILVRLGIVNHSLPVTGLTEMQATVIQVTLAGKTVKILSVYFSPSRPLKGGDLTNCFGGGLPVLMAVDLHAKHMDWNSRLNTRRGKSYVMLPRRTPVRSLDRTHLQPTVTTSLVLPISWKSYKHRT
jgi:hypothetical protein